MTRVQYMSDTHAEWHDDHGKAFVETLPVECDVLVLAGDIGQAHGGSLLTFLRAVLARFAGIPVLHVPGNHEYYNGGGRERVFGDPERARRHGQDKLRKVTQRLKGEVTNYHGGADPFDGVLAGQRFVAATMWFGSPAPDAPYEAMNDYRFISGFAEWERGESQRHLGFIRRNATPDTIVVTHHLPTMAALHPRYHGARSNPFYVHPDAGAVLRDCRPMAWIHGHSHEALRAREGDTVLLRNPFGYSGHETVRGFSRFATFDTERPDLGCPHPDLVAQPPAPAGWVGP